MPRPQRTRCQSLRPDALPYKKTARRRLNGTSLPDDALSVIFSKLLDAAHVVRCAATCARWGRVVATSAATISRPLPPLGRFLPQLAVGVFHLQRDGPTARTRSAPGAPQPCFLPMASGRRLLDCQASTSMGSLFTGTDGAVFDYSCPVASRNGRLVLEFHGDGLTFCVCNPMTGHVVVLPPCFSSVSGGKDDSRPANYNCALLTGDDLHPRRCTKFFRLLLVYNRRPGFTALRCYSSDTGRWGAEARSPVDVSSRELRHMGHAVVLHGAAFWPLDQGALGCVFTPMIRSNSDDIQNGKKESSFDEKRVPMHQMKMTWRDFTLLKIRWVGEKSGLILFTIGSGRHSGTHGLNLWDGTVEKLADEGHSWGNLVGFEMDWEAYLTSMARNQLLCSNCS
ncbi:hypothetical protein BS78_03G261400 [Paspalum vaginatum]|nr:hypothetical protein BS78_03G261400 [Paspalum vaginatum]